MAMNAGTAAVAGRRRHRRRPVMSEINVTPMVDVMLVLLIIFMVTAPLMTVGVPIDLPQTQAKSVDLERQPLVISLNAQDELFLLEEKIAPADLVTKLKAVAEARAGGDASAAMDERIFVRADRGVGYEKVAKLLVSIRTAGFRRSTLVTDIEQGQAR
jgi:biopolymer transport protein TolR